MLHVYRLLAIALLPLAALLPTPASAQATFTVNSAADPGDGACDAAECTLREAITAANAAPGADRIHFAIPGPGVRTIQPATDLPAAVGPLTIDGYTQPGASPNTLAVGNNAVLLIQLSGTGSGRGLTLRGTGAVVRGLVVNGFGSNLAGGIFADDGSGHGIAGNFIGTDPTGTLDLGNGEGVVVFRIPGVRIGGVTPADRNVISGNTTGVVLSDAPNNVVEGNYIGTTADGTAALGSNEYAVSVSGGGNVIGGTAPGAGNVIAASRAGVFVAAGASPTTIQGNRIGTDVFGTTALPNNEAGIVAIDSYGLLIGGTTAGAGNVISGNTGQGVSLYSVSGPAVATIQRNLIGVAADGASPLGNGQHGVRLAFGGGAVNPVQAVIGGTEPAVGNVIAHNGGNGVVMLCCDDELGTVLGNAIYANGGLDIDLGGSGPTANDPGDADSGPNRYQNHPEITASGLSGAGALVATYRVDTDPAHAAYPLRVEFFRALGGGGAAFLGADTYAEADHGGCGSPPCDKVASFVPAAPLAEADSLVATATDADGNTSEFTVLPGVVVANEPSPGGAPAAFALSAAQPNPSGGRVQLTLEVQAPLHVRAAVYDALGRRVAVLHEGPLTAGVEHRLTIDGSKLPAGVYFVRVTGEGFVVNRPLTLVR